MPALPSYSCICAYQPCDLAGTQPVGSYVGQWFRISGPFFQPCHPPSACSLRSFASLPCFPSQYSGFFAYHSFTPATISSMLAIFLSGFGK